MTPIDTSTVLQHLNWRYATKLFDPSRKISDADWKSLEEAIVLTPSSYGLQPWRFYVVTDQAVKEQLSVHSWGQKQPAMCSHLLVLTAKKRLGEAEIGNFVSRTAEVRGVPADSLAGYRQIMIQTMSSLAGENRIDDWAQNQVYIALGAFMTIAAMMNIDTCPMEGIDRAKFDEVLKLKDTGYATVVACPAGYRAAGDKYAHLPKVRFKHADVIHRV